MKIFSIALNSVELASNDFGNRAGFRATTSPQGLDVLMPNTRKPTARLQNSVTRAPLCKSQKALVPDA